MSLRKIITVYIAIFLCIAGFLKLFQSNVGLVTMALNNDYSSLLDPSMNTDSECPEEMKDLLNNNNFNGNFLEDNSFSLFMKSLK